MTDFSNRRRNPNDTQTDDIALGPVGPEIVIKSMEGAYNEPGLPTPPEGWGRKLPIGEEAMEKYYPDLNDTD